MSVLKCLLEISVYSAVILIVLLLFKSIFKEKLSPKLHFLLWGILILRLCIPFTVESGIYFFPIPEETAVVQEMEYTEQITESEQTDLTTETPAQTKPEVTTETQQKSESDLITQTIAAMEEAQANPNAAVSPTFLQWLFTNWVSILLAVWILGIFIKAVCTIRSAVWLKHRIRKNGKPLSEELLFEYEQIKAELWIEAEIPIVHMEKLSTPALTAEPYPVLLLPEEIGEKDLLQFRYSVLHELTHYRRKDHLVLLLLQILECVYWFSPTVWIARKMIISDMETACDSDVTNRMNTKEKQSYAMTILNLFSEEPRTEYVLGMAQGKGKKSAEKRIRGIYMKNKTKKQGKITALLLTTAILVGCFTTACQPTPESEIVAGKNNGLLEEKLNGEAATEKYEAPTTYTDEYSAYDDRLNVKIDADVTLNMDTFSVSSFEKVSKFSAEEGQRFLTALVGNAKLYAMSDTSTKKELEEQLIQLKKSYEAKKNGEDMDEDEGGSTLEDYEKMMQNLEAQIANAPAEIEKQEVSISDFNGDYFDATFENNDGTSGRVQISGNIVTYRRQGIQYYYIGNGNTIDGDLPHLNITKAEAIEKATELVNTMGITDYVPINVVEGAAVESGLEDPQADEKVYCIVFQRGFGNGMPFSDLNTVVGGSDSEYAKYIEPEALYVYIDDAGIEYVEWRGFNRLKEELNRNVELLPFENTMEKFKTYETVSNASFEEYSDYRQIITIKKITLGYVEVRQKNTENCVMYVLAWRFYGMNQSTNINGKWSEKDANENELILTINAIDGTWIGI